MCKGTREVSASALLVAHADAYVLQNAQVCRWAGKTLSHLHTLLNSRKGTSHISGQWQKVPIKSGARTAVQLSNWLYGSKTYVACELLLLHLVSNLTQHWVMHGNYMSFNLPAAVPITSAAAGRQRARAVT